MKFGAYLFLLLSMVTFSGVAAGNEVVGVDKQLIASCHALSANPEQESVASCLYYIQGFLAATQMLDPPIYNEQSDKNGEKRIRWWSSFMNRVYRTRGVKRRDQTAPMRVVPFCIPGDEPESRVIEIVSNQLQSPIDTRQMLRNRIYAALKTEYPCVKPKAMANEETDGD